MLSFICRSLTWPEQSEVLFTAAHIRALQDAVGAVGRHAAEAAGRSAGLLPTLQLLLPAIREPVAACLRAFDAAFAVAIQDDIAVPAQASSLDGIRIVCVAVCLLCDRVLQDGQGLTVAPTQASPAQLVGHHDVVTRLRFLPQEQRCPLP